MSWFIEQSSPLFTHSGNIKLVALATVIGIVLFRVFAFWKVFKR